MISKLLSKLRDPEYRGAFVASQIDIGIPFQIRALRKAKGWTQAELANHAGMLQPRISAIQNPGKASLNIRTLRRLAEAFDCGLLIRFAPFSELTLWSERFNPETFHVSSYQEELDKGVFCSLVDDSIHQEETTALDASVTLMTWQARQKRSKLPVSSASGTGAFPNVRKSMGTVHSTVSVYPKDSTGDWRLTNARCENGRARSCSIKKTQTQGS